MDWLATLVGGALGFAASFGTAALNRLWDRAGKIKIYYVLRHGDKMQEDAAFGTCSSGFVFVLPLSLEIQNTSNTSRVIRDLCAATYLDGKVVDELVSITSVVTESKGQRTVQEYGGDKQSYSFVIPPRSIQRQYCTFMLTPDEDEKDAHKFNEVRLKYHDENDRIQELHLLYIHECWKIGKYGNDMDDWTLLGKHKTIKPVPACTGEEVLISENKASYLQMIQEPISRMSTSSAIFKGFAAATIAGISAITYAEVSKWILALSFIPVILFFCLDLYYIKLEKQYRYLYELVRTDAHVIDYSIKPPKDNSEAKSRIIDCLKSPSIWLFYPVMLLIIVAVYMLKAKGAI